MVKSTKKYLIWGLIAVVIISLISSSILILQSIAGNNNWLFEEWDLSSGYLIYSTLSLFKSLIIILSAVNIIISFVILSKLFTGDQLWITKKRSLLLVVIIFSGVFSLPFIGIFAIFPLTFGYYGINFNNGKSISKNKLPNVISLIALITSINMMLYVILYIFAFSVFFWYPSSINNDFFDKGVRWRSILVILSFFAILFSALNLSSKKYEKTRFIFVLSLTIGFYAIFPIAKNYNETSNGLLSMGLEIDGLIDLNIINLLIYSASTSALVVSVLWIYEIWINKNKDNNESEVDISDYDDTTSMTQNQQNSEYDIYNNYLNKLLISHYKTVTYF